MSYTAMRQAAGPGEAELIEVLGNRFGDGLIYIRRDQHPAYHAAIKMGYISHEGFLTTSGRTFLADHDAL